MITVADLRVLHTRDRLWRVEIHDTGRVVLIHRGAVVLRGTLEQAGQRLAAEGVDPAELVED